MVKVPNWLLIFLIVLVSLAWFSSFTYSMISSSYEPPESINVLFASIVTGLVLGAGKKKKDDDDEGDNSNKSNTGGGTT